MTLNTAAGLSSWGGGRVTWNGLEEWEEAGCLTSWLGILLMREAGGVPVRRIICCSWFMSTASVKGR